MSELISTIGVVGDPYAGLSLPERVQVAHVFARAIYGSYLGRHYYPGETIPVEYYYDVAVVDSYPTLIMDQIEAGVPCNGVMLPNWNTKPVVPTKVSVGDDLDALSEAVSLGLTQRGISHAVAAAWAAETKAHEAGHGKGWKEFGVLPEYGTWAYPDFDNFSGTYTLGLSAYAMPAAGVREVSLPGVIYSTANVHDPSDDDRCFLELLFRNIPKGYLPADLETYRALCLGQKW